MIGNTWPGETISFLLTFFLDAILIILALSFADIPVVIPFLASIEIAKAVGKQIAEKAKKAKINKVAFDRSGFLYHGRVKALAESARENGLDF